MKSALLLFMLVAVSVALTTVLPARADPDGEHKKTRSTFYTPEKVANAR